MKLLKTTLIIALLAAYCMTTQAAERVKQNFNANWRLCVGDYPEAIQADFDDSRWQQVTLPYAFNGDEAFRKDIVNLTDTICWYRKTFPSPLTTHISLLTTHPSPLNTSSSLRVYVKGRTSI